MTGENKKRRQPLQESPALGFWLFEATAAARYFQSFNRSSNAMSKAAFMLLCMILIISFSRMDYRFFFFFLSFSFWLSLIGSSPHSRSSLLEFRLPRLRLSWQPFVPRILGGFSCVLHGGFALVNTHLGASADSSLGFCCLNTRIYPFLHRLSLLLLRFGRFWLYKKGQPSRAINTNKNNS